MNPPKPFPILRLPFIPLQEIFKAMDPFEIINFSLISKRTKAVTRQMTSNSTYLMQLIISRELMVCTFAPKYMTACTHIFTPYKEINGKIEESVSDGWNEVNVWKYSNNLVEEWKQFIKHVLEIFKMQTIDLFSIRMDTFVDQNVSIIDFVKTNVKSVSDCHLFELEKKNVVDEHVAYLLKNIKITYEFYSELQCKNANFNGKTPKNLTELHIENSQWIRYKKLLNIDSKRVILGKNRISDEQWNLFFKKWIAMETNKNLKYLELDKRELDRFRALVLHDIPHEVVDRGVKRVMKTRENETQEINGGIDIRRIDGKTATFFVYRVLLEERFAMSIH